MDVQQIGERVVGFIEEMFVELGAGNDFAAMEREVLRMAYSRAVSVTGWPARVTKRVRMSMKTAPSSRCDWDLSCRAPDQRANPGGSSVRSNGFTR